jgi:CheY-like chemotaxis protein
MVSSRGCEAVVVHDGPAALAVLRSRPVALMVLDNYMPSMSGLDVLRSLWSDGEFTGPPVVMFSASDHVESEARRLGAVAFISKADAGGLLRVLAEHVPTTQAH